MIIDLLGPDGTITRFNNVQRYRFANRETFGLTDTLKHEYENLLIVNAENFVAMQIVPEESD